MNPVPSMNIIGCGRLGKTLASLWHRQGLLQIRGITTRTSAGAQAAVDFIGAGTPTPFDILSPADITMIATDDASIATCAVRLAEAGIVRPGDIVFHCSGALASDILIPVKRCQGWIASVHPIKSFAEPATATASFPGTYCGVEGDEQATACLTPLFINIGGIPLPLQTDTKALYHAGMAIGANFLVTLMQWSLDILKQAGLPQETGLKVLEPMIRNTLDNVFRLGPADALTGPVARRDADIVRRHLEALQSDPTGNAELYGALAQKTLELARKKALLPEDQEQAMEALLKKKAPRPAP